MNLHMSKTPKFENYKVNSSSHLISHVIFSLPKVSVFLVLCDSV